MPRGKLIQLRRGTTAQWTEADEASGDDPARLLAKGEPGLDTTTGVLKVGDGATKFADLDGFLAEDALAASYLHFVAAGDPNDPEITLYANGIELSAERAARAILAAQGGNEAMLPATQRALRGGASLLFHDTFERSTCGWGQLIDGTMPQCPPTLVPYPATSGGGMALRTMDALLVRRGGKASAVKRLSRRSDGGEYILEFVWGWSARYGPDRFRCVEFGLDTADAAGVRNFPRLRWMNYVDAPTPGFPTVGPNRSWYISTGESLNPSYQQALDAQGNPIVSPFGFNEGKLDQLSCALHVDIGARRWRGIQVGYTGYGSLAARPQPWDIPFADEQLPDFAYGLNAIVTMSNPLAAARCSSTVVVTEARGVML